MDISEETIVYQQYLEARRAVRNDPYADYVDREHIEVDTERAMTEATIAWLKNISNLPS